MEVTQLPIETIPLQDLNAVVRRNRECKWPMRSRDNRLEPICMPRFDPSFQFHKKHKIFTIGSCFASNIRNGLIDEGFDVYPSDIIKLVDRRYRVNNLAFRYSPPTILQTFQWALEPKTLPSRKECFIATKDGQFFDPTIDHKSDGPLSEIEQISRLVTQNDRAASECEIIVITLGVAECIYDLANGLYLETWPGNYITRERQADYEVHVLSVEDILGSLESLYGLLSRYLSVDFRILLTVSPVPLQITFRDCDVISANDYSKSCLRAASEQFSIIHENVDYLPVYESVILSDRVNSWDVDLRHPSQFIVKLNTMRLMKEYYPASCINEKMIEEFIENKKQYFEETWPQQMRAYKGTQNALDIRFIEYKNKADQLQRALNAEIDRLMSENERLQKINEKHVSSFDG